MTGFERYRWTILAVGSFAAAATAMFRMGLPSLGPALRDQFDLSLVQVGLIFTTVSSGVAIGLVPWGMLTDKVGERPVLGFGMVATACTLVFAAFAPNFELFLSAMLLAGLAGASATGASGRAVMAWFAVTERGTALGIRQMAIPIGGAIGSLLLPLLAHADGVEFAFLFLAGMALTAAVTSAVWVRDPAVSGESKADLEKPMSDGRQWRLGMASALLVVGQSAALGFFVLFLHDERGLSIGLAAGCLAAIQLLGATGRIVSGRLSDVEGVRIPLLRHIALAMAILFAATAALTQAPGIVLYPVLISAGVVALTWNALAFTAAAEIAGLTKAATAMGLQNTIVSVGAIAAPVAFGLLVEQTSYPVGFAAVALGPIAAFALLRTLQDDEAERARERRDVLQSSANPTEVAA